MNLKPQSIHQQFKFLLCCFLSDFHTVCIMTLPQTDTSDSGWSVSVSLLMLPLPRYNHLSQVFTTKIQCLRKPHDFIFNIIWGLSYILLFSRFTTQIIKKCYIIYKHDRFTVYLSSRKITDFNYSSYNFLSILVPSFVTSFNYKWLYLGMMIYCNLEIPISLISPGHNTSYIKVSLKILAKNTCQIAIFFLPVMKTNEEI